MKIFIDINHPAHVHYFRNFIKIMESKGHNFVITNRNEKIINVLLDYYNIKHKIRNIRPKKKSYFKSIIYLLKTKLNNIIVCIQEKPDFYISESIVGFLFNKPALEIEDTEHNSLSQKLYLPFCSSVLTPFYFYKNLGEKQLYFNAFLEQLYLHKNYFHIDDSIYKDLNLEDNSNYAFLRYTSFDANHDHKVIPLSWEVKKKIVKELSMFMPVFISFEKEIEDTYLTQFSIHISPEKIHSVIANASIFISEGATMACEAGLLGVPYIYINPLQKVGNIMEQVKMFPQIAHSTLKESDIFEIINKLKSHIFSIKEKNNLRLKWDDKTIDLTAFLVWFIENYPKSSEIIKKNPEYQYNFK